MSYHQRESAVKLALPDATIFVHVTQKTRQTNGTFATPKATILWWGKKRNTNRKKKHTSPPAREVALACYYPKSREKLIRTHNPLEFSLN
jgi:hypothetical protein